MPKRNHKRFPYGRVRTPLVETFRRDGRPTGPGRTPLVDTNIKLDAPLKEWLQDRAAILGVHYTTLARDVLATWRILVVQGEAEAGVVLDLPEETVERVIVPERVPGYVSSLVPAGHKKSHLDDSPLRPEELTNG